MPLGGKPNSLIQVSAALFTVLCTLVHTVGMNLHAVRFRAAGFVISEVSPLFSPTSFLPPPHLLISNRTLMGPYGVDRAVHSMEFTDCENGLGKHSCYLQQL